MLEEMQGGGSDSTVAASVMESVASRLNGFFYRCQNDSGYTMLVMTEGIAALTGYPASDFLHNKVRTFTSIVSPDDTGAVDAAVGAAIGAATCSGPRTRCIGRRPRGSGRAGIVVAILRLAPAFGVLQ